ncbi:MAG: diacylglycerol kinase family protein, partial [Alphaproteobacteria bacterium]
GGDGTLRSALAIAGAKTPNLLLLPGGTMNLLAKSIHGDHPWNQILANTIKSPRHIIIPAGDLNGERFYCAMLAGAPARFAEARESLRRGDIGNVVTGARVALEALQTIHLKARVGEGYQCADDRLPVTSFIGAMVGPLVKNGRMEIAALTDTTTTGALNVMWTSFLSDWRSAPGVKIVESDTLIIDSEEDDAIPVILDGETIEAGSRIEVIFVEEAARCLTAA